MSHQQAYEADNAEMPMMMWMSSTAEMLAAQILMWMNMSILFVSKLY